VKDIKFFLITLLVVSLIAWFAMQIVADFSTQATCLKYGWKDHAVTWNFERYCIREEDEFEITKPLSVIIEESR